MTTRVPSGPHILVFALTSLLGCLLAGLLDLPGTPTAQADDASPPAVAAEATQVWVVDFKEDIEGVLAAYVGRHLDRAAKERPDFLILRIDSPGGTVFHSMQIAEQVFRLPPEIHTIAWVERQAISGACMVAMACDEIVMGRAGTIGDCQPIVMNPESGGVTPVGEKMESPLRALFRKYAESAGHPVALAEAFVSEHLEVIEVVDTRTDTKRFIDGAWYRDAEPEDTLDSATGATRADLNRIGAPVVEKGELLTLTGPETRRLGFMVREFPGDGFPESEAALIAAVAGPDAVVTNLEKTFSERMAKVLTLFAGLLAALVVLAVILFFMQGPGMMTIVGLGALVLILLINVTAEQLHAFPLFLVLLGIVLLVVEMFVIPGFGIFGILGIAAMGFGFLLLISGSTLDGTGPSLDRDMAMSFGLQFIGGCLAGIALIVFLSRVFPTFGPGKRLLLAPSSVEAGAAITLGEGASLRPGMRGVAGSTLRPAGSARFGEVHADVTSDGRYIDAGTTIHIVAIEGTRITVAPVDGAAGDPSPEPETS